MLRPDRPYAARTEKPEDGLPANGKDHGDKLDCPTELAPRSTQPAKRPAGTGPVTKKRRCIRFVAGQLDAHRRGRPVPQAPVRGLGGA